MLQLLIICFFCSTFTNEKVVILSIILTLIFMAIKIIINKKDNKSEIARNNLERKIPIGFYLCYANIIIMILGNFILK